MDTLHFGYSSRAALNPRPTSHPSSTHPANNNNNSPFRSSASPAHRHTLRMAAASASPKSVPVTATPFQLVGHSRFVRHNPLSDLFPVHSFHHVEFWCSDATTASRRFSFSLGLPLSSFSDLSTGNHTHASYLLHSPHSHLRFLFTAPYPSLPSPSSPSIPSFDAAACRRFTSTHGLGIRAVALLVDDAAEAFRLSVARGARPASPPADLGDGAASAEVELYGDVVLRYVSLPDNPPYCFLPGFNDVDEGSRSPPSDLGDLGIRRLDHAVGNVPAIAPVMEYVRGFTGFHEFAEFTAEEVGTAESGLNSVVLANNAENVLLPLNEPVEGKRRSQIQTYLDYNMGPGLQHLALATVDVLKTVREMRRRSRAGGFEFMPSPPPTYYRNLRARAGDVLTEEQMRECEELGVLVDRDDQGVLLQIFTKPVGDRPTLFLEIIQRIGCMVKDQKGNLHQKGGCGGFGKGNFSQLFKSIEEYEKSLEVEQQCAVPSA